MAFIPDLSRETYSFHNEWNVDDPEDADEFDWVSVGWLGSRVEQPGETDPEIIDRLRMIKVVNQLGNGWRGSHVCEICLAEKGEQGTALVRGESLDKGEFCIDQGMTRYVLPNMVIHYITRHKYKLPGIIEQLVREWKGGVAGCR